MKAKPKSHFTISFKTKTGAAKFKRMFAKMLIANDLPVSMAKFVYQTYCADKVS